MFHISACFIPNAQEPDYGEHQVKITVPVMCASRYAGAVVDWSSEDQASNLLRSLRLFFQFLGLTSLIVEQHWIH